MGGSGKQMFASLQKVRWARHPTRAAIEHMGIDHRGLNIAMAKQFLDGADVMAALQ